MKILYLHQYFNTPKMNGGTRSYEMARRMVAAGHEVHMVTSIREDNSKSSEWSYTNEDGIHVYWLSVPYNNKMSYFKRILAFFQFAIKARKKLIKLGGDIIFATSTPLTIAIPAVYAKKKLGIPLVFEVRDLWPELPIVMGAIKSPLLKWAARRLEMYAYFNSEHVVGLSPGMSEGVAARGYPVRRISTIPNSCDLALFCPKSNDGTEFRNRYSWLQERPLVIYAGTLGHINGVSYLADLAAKVYPLNPDVRFLVIGSGVDEEKVRNRAIELGIYDKNFFMLEKVAKKDIPAVFAAATISTSLFINLPEMWINSANKFFDALAAGKPVAINYGGWQKDIVEREKLGLVLSTEPTEEAAKSLVEFLSNNECLSKCGVKSRKIAEEMYSRDKLAEDLITILENTHFENCVT
jgi:glycosyltransferase involved in cell wall biosynthesis